MFNFTIFSYLKMGGETMKQLTIQVSRARPPGPAWLRRFKHKFKANNTNNINMQH